MLRFWLRHFADIEATRAELAEYDAAVKADPVRTPSHWEWRERRARESVEDDPRA